MSGLGPAAEGWVVMQATENWIEMKRASPLPGRSYLVASEVVGIVMDVAFFTGARPGGGLWWTMTNAEFPSAAITHWATLVEPVS